MVALLLRREQSWTEIAELVEQSGSAAAVLEQTGTTLFDDSTADLERAAAEIEGWRADGIEVITVLDEAYPQRLRLIHQRPPLLWYRGDISLASAPGVAVVGTRQASPAGLEQARQYATRLAEAGAIVVSGLAAGIDTAAHTAALDASGTTVAVIGTGLRRSYPATNAKLQERIAEVGCVISQFLPDQPPTRYTFPWRNAVMSGLALATLVVEASSTSGAKMQARLALEHGRHVIFPRSMLEHLWAQQFAERSATRVVDSPEDASAVVTQIADLYRPNVELVWA